MKPIGEPFVQLIEVESSNNYAMAKVQAQLAEHGFACFANHQTAGKGQRGKSWNMEPGQNIILTMVIEPTVLQIHNSFYLSAAVALACYDLFAKYALEETSIKWPNDIYWRDRKAGGILIENVLQSTEWKFAIVGIGININQTTFPAHIPNPVSLKQIAGKTFDCIALAKELCNNLEGRWKQLLKGENEQLLNEYNSILYKKNRLVKFKKANLVFEATVKSVTKGGELVVENGTENLLSHGDYEWIIEKAK